MPFKSEKQRKLMWAKHPEIAKRWADEAKRKKKKPDEHKGRLARIGAKR